ncbi:MAG TPA: hypothetical protein VF342_10895 [Alphaproteobacteria bacterium]
MSRRDLQWPVVSQLSPELIADYAEEAKTLRDAALRDMERRLRIRTLRAVRRMIARAPGRADTFVPR